MGENAIEIFDRSLSRTRQKRIQKNFDHHRFLYDWTNQQLDGRLQDIKRSFSQTLNVNLLQSLYNEHCPIIFDEEFLPFADQSLDLFKSCLTLHTINDLPGALIQIRRSLKPDGLFLAALFGGETLFELRDSLAQAEMKTKNGISPRVFPFADKQQMGALMQRAGFALPVVDSDILTVTYESSFKLMQDLRGMGQSNIIHQRMRINPGKDLFFEAERYYKEKYAEPHGRIRASFEIIFLIGWAPHESQQKALRPGSAKSSLAQALNTQETKL